MKNNQTLTIVELSTLTGMIANGECTKAGLPYMTPLMIGAANGLDVGLTLWEASGGLFEGFSRQSAERASTYFRAEAERSRSIDRRIAIWYESWAKAIELTYLQGSVENPA